jgi:hypothetical protein
MTDANVVVGTFGNSTSFSAEIEETVRKFGIGYVDAIVHYCEKNRVEPEYVATLVKRDKVLVSRLQIEAEDLNILKKGARLPV